MTVYILMHEYPYGRSNILGVFDSLEKAKKAESSLKLPKNFKFAKNEIVIYPYDINTMDWAAGTTRFR